MPGLYWEPSSSTPTDALVRFTLDYIFQVARRGSKFTSGEQVDSYLDNPRGVYPPIIAGAFKFPVASSSSPVFAKSSGSSSDDLPKFYGQSGKLTINSGKRMGLVIEVGKRRTGSNSHTAPSKFCTEAHPYFDLVSSALPPGTPSDIILQAKKSFSCSVSRNTQQNYATGRTRENL